MLHRERFPGIQFDRFSHYLILVQFVIFCILASPPVFAETLEVRADILKSGFDYRVPYRGQTFMLPAAVKADRLTVYVSPSIFQSFTFNLLITEVDTANGLHPTTILFEAGPFTIPRGGSGFIPYTADLGGLTLYGGKLYAFILDIFVSLSQIESETLWQYSTLTGMNEGGVYTFGDHIYLGADCTDSITGLPCGSREDHFAGTWIADTSEDMGFLLEYDTVPSLIPSVIQLLLLKLRDPPAEAGNYPD
ncbi:MAG: hypothetical protein SCH71_14595 [Desulfobulbaceae bacterium]|nr:hypothetical protein [Desulfobulbaceae bacterium]